jgi:hypothetical protein
MNNQRREHLAGMARARWQLAGVDTEISNLVQVLTGGLSSAAVKDEWATLETRKAEDCCE